MSKEKIPCVLVCARKDTLTDKRQIGLLRHCADCECEVIINPTSVSIIKENEGDLVFLCIDCGYKAYLKSGTGAKVMPLTPEQIKEVRRLTKDV